MMKEEVGVIYMQAYWRSSKSREFEIFYLEIVLLDLNHK
jgi:hypothetical protein